MFMLLNLYVSLLSYVYHCLSHCPFSFISLLVPLSFFFYIIACPIVPLSLFFYIIAFPMVLFPLYHCLSHCPIFSFLSYHWLFHCPFSFISLLVPLSFFYITACPIVPFLLYHCLSHCHFSFISLLLPLSFFFYIIACPIVLFLLSIALSGARVAQWVRSLDLRTHTSISPIRRGFAPGCVNHKRVHSTGSRRWQSLPVACPGRWFSGYSGFLHH